MTAVMKNMIDWILAWMPHEVIGGFPRRYLTELHEEMHRAICECDDDEIEFAGEKVDLRKAFDKADAEQSVHILVRLGLPQRIGEIVLSLVQGQRKWFEWDGAVARAPVRVKNSLLQGCPTSMPPMAAQAALWVCQG